MNSVEWAGVLLGSGVISGIVGWIASYYQGKDQRLHEQGTQAVEHDHQVVLHEEQREHERRIQEDVREHEMLLRRREAHDQARGKFLPVAEQVVHYFTKMSFDIHSDEVGIYYYPATELTQLTEKAEVNDAVRRIMWGHPSAAVRQQAHRLFDDLVELWYDAERHQDRGGYISQDEANVLQARAERLVQLIHTPEPVVVDADPSDAAT